jgi:hypothetical protein
VLAKRLRVRGGPAHTKKPGLGDIRPWLVLSLWPCNSTVRVLKVDPKIVADQQGHTLDVN